MRALDEAVFRWINGWPDSWTSFFRFLSEGSKEPAVRIGFATIVLAMVLRGQRSRIAAILAVLAFLMANELTDVLKGILPMQRPCNDLTDALVRITPLLSSGTASAHAANMAAVAAVFLARLRWWGTPWAVLALLVGLSRIYVGVHYPSQVLFGWLCGLFAAFVAVATYGAWERTRHRAAQMEQDTECPTPEEKNC